MRERIALHYAGMTITKRQAFMFATLLFALALSLKLVPTLQIQARTVASWIILSLIIISVALHYFFIYRRATLPLFHAKHTLGIIRYYVFVFAALLVMLYLDYLITGRTISLLESIFLLAIGSIFSLISYEASD